MTSRSDRSERPPWPVAAVAAVAVLFVAVPVVGLLTRTPWSDVGDLVTEPDFLNALRVSALTSVAATVVVAAIGLPLAWWLASTRSRSVGPIRALVSLSMVMPPVVAGVAMFAAWGRNGLIGSHLGPRVAFTPVGVVMAQAFVAMPFFVLTVEAAMAQLDRAPADAARTLGASRWFAFVHVTLPSIRPALVAGAVLAWARALGEFGATITFGGNVPGSTRTLPLAAYLALQENPDRANTIAAVLIATSFAVLVGLRSYWTAAWRGAR